jgi:hypothetical protein
MAEACILRLILAAPAPSLVTCWPALPEWTTSSGRDDFIEGIHPTAFGINDYLTQAPNNIS